MTSSTARARIVLVGGEKGGTGKTTLATNLAAMRAAATGDLLLIDTDTQGSADGWCTTRTDSGVVPQVFCVQKFGKGLANELDGLAKRYRDIIVDAGGRDSIELRAALTRADVLLSPIQASQFDLWTLQALDNLIQQASGFNPRLRSLLVISRAPTNPSQADAQHAAELVADYRTFDLTKAIVKDRKVYRSAAAAGQGVVEFAGAHDRATDEMLALYEEVYGEAYRHGH